MHKSIWTAFGILLSVTLLAQSPKKASKELGENPVYFIDSVHVEQSDLMNYSPEQIASVSVYKDNNAIELVGEEGKDGVVYIETKAFARERFWKYFSRKSIEYASIVKTSAPNDDIQYILNGRILTGNFEGDLSLIDDDIFEGIEIIDQETLERKYKVKEKVHGIVITSGKPDNLYKAKKKF